MHQVQLRYDRATIERELLRFRVRAGNRSRGRKADLLCMDSAGGHRTFGSYAKDPLGNEHGQLHRRNRWQRTFLVPELGK